MSENMTESNFFSMNRLVEFGMGMAVARQMVQSMNETMEKVRIPGADNPMMQMVERQIYYIVFEGKQAGPFSDTELARLANEHKITKDTLVWRAGMASWKKAEDTPEVLRLVALAPPPLPTE